MSILIKGMEMPSNCPVCELCGRYEEHKGTVYRCDLTMYPIKNFEARLDNCPLIEIPPHGRLIDADALANEGWTLHKEVMRMGGYAIHELPLKNPSIPVIIPAEKGEDK